MISPELREEVMERFMASLPPEKKGSDCWLWQGPVRQDGYGIFCHKRKRFRAHRLSWHLAAGMDIPEGKQINHKCHQPACVNPSHLYCGSQQDNMNDMINAGRGVWVKGEAHGRANVPDKLIREAVSMVKSGFSLRNAAAFIRAKGYPTTHVAVYRWSKGDFRKSSLNGGIA